MGASNVNRRGFLKGAAAAGLGLAGLGSVARRAGGQSAATRPDRPNIVFMMTDDQRADALGIAGNPVVKTPNMDRIAREGVRFANMFVTNSLCAPSRACMLTGKYSHVHGVTTNAARWRQQPTFLDHLRQAGYHTCGIGKFHCGGTVVPSKFDLFMGFTDQGQYRNPRLLDFDGKLVQETGHMTDLLGDRAVKYLREHRRDPFCLVLWFKSPHRDWQPADRFAETYKDAPIPRPPSWQGPGPDKPPHMKLTRMQVETAKKGADFDRWVRDYYRTIAGVDENVGRVLAALDALKLADNTIVVFTSDNGFLLGEYHYFDKRLMHEPSIRVPLLVRYPRLVAKGGRVATEMVLNVDIAPTLLDLCGLAVPAEMQGRSCKPLLAGRPTDWRKSWYYEYFEFPGPHWVAPHHGVRTERYKLIEWPALKTKQLDVPAFSELYDLQADPDEMTNLAGRPEQAERLAQLRAELARLRKELNVKDKPN